MWSTGSRAPATPLVTAVAVGLGGAVGALARFGLARLVTQHSPAGFPWATLTVNVVGCLILGIIIHAIEVAAIPPSLQKPLIIGVLGSFTTFSAFSWDLLVLVRKGQMAGALIYAGGSVALGVLALVGGLALARTFGVGG